MTDGVETGSIAVNPDVSELAAGAARARLKKATIEAVVIRRDAAGNVLSVENRGVIASLDNRTMVEKLQDRVHGLFRKITRRG